MNGREMEADLVYRLVKPEAALADYVESFWLLKNESKADKEVVILPDGRVDLFFSISATEPFHVTLLGMETQYGVAIIPPGYLTFAISFKPLAVEYILHEPIANLLNTAINMPEGFWGFSKDDMEDFDAFCEAASKRILFILPDEIDSRKKILFDMIYSSAGALTVKELSEKSFWSSRQINRYFNHQFGITLKAYCNILRFRASFEHIKEGKLFPTQNFADQAHFIKEVKRLSGVLPKVLKQNENDRFIQFSTLPGK